MVDKNRPQNPQTGEIYFDNTTHTLLEWNGNAWVPLQLYYEYINPQIRRTKINKLKKLF